MRKAARKNPQSQPQENKDSCDMHLLTFSEWDELEDEGKLKPGDFYWGETVVTVGNEEFRCRSLWHVLPSGDHGCIQIEPVPEPIKDRIKHGSPPKAHTWTWNGDINKPTLSPSVWLKGRWHGYFEQGRMRSC